MIKCPGPQHNSDGPCDWCCGAGRVTKFVADIIQNKLTRSPTPPPTEPGYYYAVREDNPDSRIFPLYVGYTGTHLAIFAGKAVLPMSEYVWFGPVPSIEVAP